MNQEELKIEYNKFKDQFDFIKQEVENNVIKTENYKGVFYELFPYSYQRSGLKQGKPIENMNRIKSTNNLFIYGFNNNGNIIEVKEGISLEGQFYYQFLFYEKNNIKSFSFDNGKILQNVSIYCLNMDSKITKGYLIGRRGYREEDYYYTENGILEKILIKQFDRNGNEGDTLQHSFEYNSDNSLKSIVKSALNNKDYSEIIFPV